MPAYRYTDVNTRTVYNPLNGKIGGAGKVAKFWHDEAGTQPVDLGVYSNSTPDTPGASTGSNQLTVTASGMWPAMWDLDGAADNLYVQVGTVDNPGDLYRIFCDADQRLDLLAAQYAALLERVEALEGGAEPASGFTFDAGLPGMVVADDTAPGIDYTAGILTVDDLLAAGVSYSSNVLTVTTV